MIIPMHVTMSYFKKHDPRCDETILARVNGDCTEYVLYPSDDYETLCIILGSAGGPPSNPHDFIRYWIVEGEDFIARWREAMNFIVAEALSELKVAEGSS